MPGTAGHQKTTRLLYITILIWIADLVIIMLSASPLVSQALPDRFSQIFFSQIAIIILIFVVLGVSGVWRQIGLRSIKGVMWIIWTSPLWLYNLSAIFAPQAALPQTSTQLAVLITLAVLVGISEETIYRGLFWSLLRPRGVWITVIVTSCLFGAVHLVSVAWGAPLVVAISRCIFAAGAGFVLAAARLRSESLLAPILLHIIVDALAFAVFGTTMFETQAEMAEQEMLGAMLGFFVLPGLVFGLWGTFAVWRIQRGLAN